MTRVKNTFIDINNFFVMCLTSLKPLVRFCDLGHNFPFMFKKYYDPSEIPNNICAKFDEDWSKTVDLGIRHLYIKL